MRLLLGLLLLAWTTAANATCSDSYYNSYRASRINAIVATIQPGDDIFVGDSHGERISTAFAQRTQSIGGHPLVVLGSAGATWQTIRDCFPWSAIGARSPHNIILQASINDVVTGQCCDANGNGTTAYAFTIMQAVLNAHGALGSGWPVLATDPPPESAQGMSAITVHNSARMVYYIATNSAACGCTWGAFGWTGTVPPGSLQFIDQFSIMASGSCDAASAAWAGNACYAAAGSTLDNVHFPYPGIVIMMTNLAMVP